jgi:uncharacterized membrane protein
MPGVFPHDQVFYILSHPFEYFKTFGKMLLFRGDEYLKQFIGLLGWVDTKLPLWLISLNVGLIVFVSVVNFTRTSDVHDSDSWKNESLKAISFSVKDRIILFGTFLLALWIVLTSQFIMWTPVGVNVILGVQGRYFIPIVPVFLLMFYNKHVYLRKKFNYIHAGLVVLCCFSLATSLLITAKRYYF